MVTKYDFFQFAQFFKFPLITLASNPPQVRRTADATAGPVEHFKIKLGQLYFVGVIPPPIIQLELGMPELVLTIF